MDLIMIEDMVVLKIVEWNKNLSFNNHLFVQSMDYDRRVHNAFSFLLRVKVAAAF